MLLHRTAATVWQPVSGPTVSKKRARESNGSLRSKRLASPSALLSDGITVEFNEEPIIRDFGFHGGVMVLSRPELGLPRRAGRGSGRSWAWIAQPERIEIVGCN